MQRWQYKEAMDALRRIASSNTNPLTSRSIAEAALRSIGDDEDECVAESPAPVDDPALDVRPDLIIHTQPSKEGST